MIIIETPVSIETQAVWQNCNVGNLEVAELGRNIKIFFSIFLESGSL